MHGKPLLILALALLGILPSQVRGQFQDFLAQQLKEQAEAGDAEAQFQLGAQLILGDTKNKKFAAQGAAWIQKAAKQGFPRAMHFLGALYEDGIGVEQDLKLAAKWYQAAADKDMPEAQTALGLLYAQGKGVEKDTAKAVDWVKKAADKNHLEAQTIYGQMLVRGDGLPKNASKAAVWYLKAAQHEEISNERELNMRAYAQRQLAYLYYSGNGVPVDYARCEAWYRRSIASGRDPMALNDLAWFLSTCPDEKFHKGKEAVEIARQAIKMIEDTTGEQRHEVIDTMAAALARCGQFGEALLWQKRCISLLKEDKEMDDEEKKKLEDEFNQRLKLYTDKKPYADKPTKPEKAGEPLLNDRVLEDAKRTQPAPQPSKNLKKKNQESVT